jgi:hypothetical protein
MGGLNGTGELGNGTGGGSSVPVTVPNVVVASLGGMGEAEHSLAVGQIYTVPTVTAASPATGPIAGGTSVTITGTGFVSGATVNFGTTPAAGVTVNSATSITATSPAGSAGVVDVTVTTPGGTKRGV